MSGCAIVLEFARFHGYRKEDVAKMLDALG